MSDIENNFNADNTVYILDSYGLIYRAYYALVNHPLTNSAGDNISAVVIFFRNLKALLNKYKPRYLAAAFDSTVKTFRHERYEQYKATRQKTPEDLHAQVPWIEEILTDLGIPVLRKDRFEADDIIATVAKKCQEEKKNCRILSGDKDLMQLVNSSVQIMKPNKDYGGWSVNGIEEVTAEWGVKPEKLLDLLSLTGDSADNVPGVKGVGDKTALKLITEYGSLENLYEHSDEIKGKLGEKIREDKDNAFFSKELITLEYNVPIEINFDDFTTKNLDFAKCGEKLKFYGAEKIGKEFLELSSEKKENVQTEECNIPRKNSGQYSPVTKLEELKNFIDCALKSPSKTIAFDTETTSLNTHTTQLVGFSLCYECGKAIYVPVILPGGMFAGETVPKKDALLQIERIYDEKDITLVMHNGKFDLEVLYSNGLKKLPSCKIADTMIAAWLIDPEGNGKNPYSLESLCEKNLLLKGTEFTDIVKKGQTFADLPLETAYPYGAEDADFTLQLWNYFIPLLKEKNLTVLFKETEMKLLPILTRMEIAGIHLDKNALEQYSQELKKNIDEKEKEIYKAAGHQFNIASTKQLQQVLFEELKLPAGKKTKTGYSTDTAVLEELAALNNVPKLILEYRSYAKLLSTYVEALPLLADSQSRIHTSFIQTGTATGRLSSRDPNLQNIPVRDEGGRRIRSAFTSAEGTVLISADYAQIELVVLAHLSADKNMCQAFNEGKDVHKATASLLYGVSTDEVTSEMRRTAKTINFGIMYGMGAFSLAKDLNISRTQAKEFIDSYFKTYSGIAKFREKTISDAKEKGFVETIMGRKRYIASLNSKNKMEATAAERIALNTPIQGTAADIVKKAMIDVQEGLDQSQSKARLLLQVHDELIFECPDDKETIEKTIALIKDKMENAFKLNVPLRVSIEYGKNWGLFH